MEEATFIHLPEEPMQGFVLPEIYLNAVHIASVCLNRVGGRGEMVEVHCANQEVLSLPLVSKQGQSLLRWLDRHAGTW